MYDGTNFCGFQDQGPKPRTVQRLLLDTLKRRFNSEEVWVTGASRTDQGVHARGQCIHFDVMNCRDQDCSQMEYSLNKMLPDDVKVYNISLPPPGNIEQCTDGKLFHATASSVEKLYIYRFCSSRFVDPLKRRHYAHFYTPFDMDLLKFSLNQFIGTHDFIAFTNRLTSSTKDYAAINREYITERTVHSVSVKSDGGEGYYRIEFRVKSALYKMLRNIVGTSLRVAEGKMRLEDLTDLLLLGQKRGKNQAVAAPAEGLTLEHVFYDHY